MTREEAIKTLKDRIEQYTGGVHPGEREILLEAFAVLCPAPAPETGLVDREPGFDSRRDGGESMMVEKWRKKPVVVEAIKWTGDNFKDIKAWSADVGLIEGVLCVSTLEGQMVAAVGDYIIKGVNGEFYPCKPDIFHKTYDAAGRIDIEPGPDSIRGNSDQEELSAYRATGLTPEAVQEMVSFPYTADDEEVTKMLVNQCVACGAEMPEGDQVCAACREGNSKRAITKITTIAEFLENLGERKMAAELSGAARTLEGGPA